MPYFEPQPNSEWADAALLHAAEGGDLGRDDALVDPDDAVFERLGDPPDAADVAAVEIGGDLLPSLPRGRGRVRVGCRWPS
jgi:hypothetical protein